MVENLKRGMVVYVNMVVSIGHEQTGSRPRPGVIVNSEETVRGAKCLQVVYLTTTARENFGCVELYTPNQKSWAKCAEVYSVDVNRVVGVMCQLTAAEMSKIELGLRKTFGLPTKVEPVVCIGTDEEERLAQELLILQKAYDRLMDKYIEVKIDRDIHEREKKMFGDDEPPMEPVIVEPDPVIVEPKPEIPQKEIDRIMENANLSCVGIGKAKLKPGAKKVNINRCSVADLVNLGMGEKTARTIVSRRKTKGQYSSKDELLKLSRFGNGCMAVFGDYLEV